MCFSNEIYICFTFFSVKKVFFSKTNFQCKTLFSYKNIFFLQIMYILSKTNIFSKEKYISFNLVLQQMNKHSLGSIRKERNCR